MVASIVPDMTPEDQENFHARHGHEQGLLEGIESVLEIRFGTEAAPILKKIRELSNVEVLRKILQAAKTIDRPENLEDLWTAESEELRRDDSE